jgi:DNA modification methylase
MGTGSTALACQRLGVSFIGFEIDTAYVDIAQKELLKQKKETSP